MRDSNSFNDITFAEDGSFCETRYALCALVELARPLLATGVYWHLACAVFYTRRRMATQTLRRR